MSFGQIVIGPPGSGKTTYCYGMLQFYNAIGRKAVIVNLDPANENIPYECKINIFDLITLRWTMQEYKLGPNSGLIYCIEYLDKNFTWLASKLEEFKGIEFVADEYVIFDFPGQVELFTHHPSLKSIVGKLEKRNYRLCCVNLIDANYCADNGKYVAALIIGLKSMLHLELPQLNVLSKIDLLPYCDKELSHRLDFYTEVQDPTRLFKMFDDDNVIDKYKQLNIALCMLICEYSLVGFYSLCIEDKDTVIRLATAIDKCNGYIFGGLERGNEFIMNSAVRWGSYYVDDVSLIDEKYLVKNINEDADASGDETMQ